MKNCFPGVQCRVVEKQLYKSLNREHFCIVKAISVLQIEGISFKLTIKVGKA